MPKTLIVITGPTAIGKTRLAIQTARYFSTKIISADSRQIYRELTIGTAVPSPEELGLAKHYFIHSHSIHEHYNASLYEMQAIQLLEELFEKHETIVMAGGSMLYIDAVCKGIDTMPDVDPELRQSLKIQLKTQGKEYLRRQLKKLDPNYYAEVDLKNPARIVHALEICLMTGKPYSSFRSSPQKKRSFEIIKIGLNCDRAELHSRINHRVVKMVEAGLEEEARVVFPLKHLNALNTVGYREFFQYFSGEISKENAIERIKRNTRRYARKQITWFRNDPEITWFHPDSIDNLIEFIENKIHQK